VEKLDFGNLTDKVAFGEVVDRPPLLRVKPKSKGITNDEKKPLSELKDGRTYETMHQQVKEAHKQAKLRKKLKYLKELSSVKNQ